MKWLMLAAVLCFPANAMAETCGGQISPEFTKQFADDWIAVWNSHDLNRILEHYSNNFEMHSPGIITVAGEPSGMLKGKATVAAYWEKALKAPNLIYELIDVFVGVRNVTVHWRRPGREVIEMMEFNSACKVVRSSVLLKI
jgi:hypothetical protein